MKFTSDQKHRFEILKDHSHFDCQIESDDPLFSERLLTQRIFLNRFEDVVPSRQLYALFDPNYVRQVPELFVKSIVVNEDSNFYNHHGFDYQAMLAALRVNLKNKGIVVGASTLTMQLVKNLYLGASATLQESLKRSCSVASLMPC